MRPSPVSRPRRGRATNRDSRARARGEAAAARAAEPRHPPITAAPPGGAVRALEGGLKQTRRGSHWKPRGPGLRVPGAERQEEHGRDGMQCGDGGAGARARARARATRLRARSGDGPAARERPRGHGIGVGRCLAALSDSGFQVRRVVGQCGIPNLSTPGPGLGKQRQAPRTRDIAPDSDSDRSLSDQNCACQGQ